MPTSSRDSQRDIEAGIDYFKLLGVREEAEAAEVVSAFRARVRAVHLDANAGAGEPERVALLVRARSTLAGPGREACTKVLRVHLIRLKAESHLRSLERMRLRQSSEATRRHRQGILSL